MINVVFRDCCGRYKLLIITKMLRFEIFIFSEDLYNQITLRQLLNLFTYFADDTADRLASEMVKVARHSNVY